MRILSIILFWEDVNAVINMKARKFRYELNIIFPIYESNLLVYFSFPICYKYKKSCFVSYFNCYFWTKYHISMKLFINLNFLYWISSVCHNKFQLKNILMQIKINWKYKREDITKCLFKKIKSFELAKFNFSFT